MSVPSSQGAAVALDEDGNTALVGAPAANAVWAFAASNGIWSQQQYIQYSNGSLEVPQAGRSVALSADGNTGIVGQPGCCNDGGGGPGKVWMLSRSGIVWGGSVLATGSGQTFGLGSSVAVSSDGATALLGAADLSNGFPIAFVYTRNGAVWTQQGATLVPSDGALGGVSVALSADGNTAVVGVPGDDSAAVFTKNGNDWAQQGPRLAGTGNSGSSGQGTSVALSSDGNTAVIGGPDDDGGVGAVWVFTRSNGAWAQQGDKLLGTGAVGASHQGASVALSSDGSTALIGGPNDNGDTGAFWLFARSGGGWTQQGQKIVGMGAAGAARQGTSVALSRDGRVVLIGGSADHTGTGAAWVFVRPCSRGDASGDGSLDVADVFYLINFLFAGGPAPPSCF